MRRMIIADTAQVRATSNILMKKNAETMNIIGKEERVHRSHSGMSSS